MKSKPKQSPMIATKTSMHRCKCGSGLWAVFGFHCFLRRGQAGVWKCAQCKGGKLI